MPDHPAGLSEALRETVACYQGFIVRYGRVGELGDVWFLAPFRRPSAMTNRAPIGGRLIEMEAPDAV